MSVVLDSNILIYFLNGALDAQARSVFERAIGIGARMSVVTRIEVLGWSQHTDGSYLRASNLLRQVSEVPLMEEIVRRGIDIRRQRRIRLPGAVIAATALEMDLPVMTRNTTDFGGVQGLEVINPFYPTAQP